MVDVLDAGLRHDFCLAQLGAGDPDGAGCDLSPGNFRCLMSLDMGAQFGRPVLKERRHPRNVGLHHVEVNQQRRGVQFIRAAPNLTSTTVAAGFRELSTLLSAAK